MYTLLHTLKILSFTSAEGIAAVKSQGNQVENENTDAKQTSEKM